MHSCEHNNRVKRRKSRKDIENTKKIWRFSGWKCIQNSMHGLWANLKRRGSCFCVIQGRKLSSFRSSAKAAGAKISVYTKILHFQQKSQWGTSWENTRVHLFSITSFHRINRMNEETKTTCSSKWDNKMQKFQSIYNCGFFLPWWIINLISSFLGYLNQICWINRVVINQ